MSDPNNEGCGKVVEETICWIAVEDQLPEIQQPYGCCSRDVLVAFKEGGSAVGHLFSHGGRSVFCSSQGDGDDLCDVTHWAELPGGPNRQPRALFSHHAITEDERAELLERWRKRHEGPYPASNDAAAT